MAGKFNAENQETIRHYFEIALRRKWLILATIIGSLGVAWAIFLITPAKYKSTTLIWIEKQKVPEHVVRTTVHESVSDRLKVIQQYVLSRTVLAQVVDEVKLGPENASAASRDSLIEGVRKSIKIETAGGGRVEADVHGGGALEPLDGAVQRRNAPVLYVAHEHVEGRLVELDEVGAGRFELPRLLVERLGKGHRHIGALAVMRIRDGVTYGHGTR